MFIALTKDAVNISETTVNFYETAQYPIRLSVIFILAAVRT
jgi:hypothetical protein